MRIKLRFNLPDGTGLDASTLLPERLCGLAEGELAGLRVQLGRQAVELGEVCLVALEPDGADELVVCGDTRRLARVGCAMRAGSIRVAGDLGPRGGERMAGGALQVDGSAGDELGAGMTGGLIRVAGDAGDRVGAALAGEKHGMLGGVVLVGGSLGAEAGARLRRGLIAARGGAGPLAGWEMRAGTLLVMGRLGPNPGLDQRRGSLVADGCAGLLPGFSCDGTDTFTWLRLYGQRLAALGWTGAPAWCRGRFTRYTGHATGIGKGEVLIYADAE